MSAGVMLGVIMGRARRAYTVIVWSLMLVVAPMLFLTGHWHIAIWSLSIVLTWGILAGYGGAYRTRRKDGTS
jgi:hypothetical protein